MASVVITQGLLLGYSVAFAAHRNVPRRRMLLIPPVSG